MMLPAIAFVTFVFGTGFALGGGHWVVALLCVAGAVYALGESAHQAAEREGRH